MSAKWRVLCFSLSMLTLSDSKYCDILQDLNSNSVDTPQFQKIYNSHDSYCGLAYESQI